MTQQTVTIDLPVGMTEWAPPMGGPFGIWGLLVLPTDPITRSELHQLRVITSSGVRMLDVVFDAMTCCDEIRDDILGDLTPWQWLAGLGEHIIVTEPLMVEHTGARPMRLKLCGSVLS